MAGAERFYDSLALVAADRPYPDISRTLLPAHAFGNGCFITDANHRHLRATAPQQPSIGWRPA